MQLSRRGTTVCLRKGFLTRGEMVDSVLSELGDEDGGARRGSPLGNRYVTYNSYRSFYIVCGFDAAVLQACHVQ